MVIIDSDKMSENREQDDEEQKKGEGGATKAKSGLKRLEGFGDSAGNWRVIQYEPCLWIQAVMFVVTELGEGPSGPDLKFQ